MINKCINLHFIYAARKDTDINLFKRGDSMDFVSITGKCNYYEGYTQIVSGMSNKELLKTLTGNDYSVSSDFIRTSECFNIRDQNPDMDFNDICKEVDEALKANRDSFSHCDELDINFNNYYGHIVFKERSLYCMDGSFWNENHETRLQIIAQHFGDIAKRLDNAYSEGKFTEEEYDMLNKSIYEQMGKSIDRMQGCEANQELLRRYYNLPPKKRREVDELLKHMSREEIQDEWRSEITAYIEKVCKNDHTYVLDMFNRIRNSAQKSAQKIERTEDGSAEADA